MSAAEVPITCTEFESRLSDYLENALSPAQRGPMDAHLLQCDICMELVRDVQNIVHDARALPLLSPSRDLWTGIASRLESPVTSLADFSVNNVQTRRTTRMFSLGQFAAAAVLLVAVSSGATYLFTRAQSVAMPTAIAPVADVGAAANGATPIVLPSAAVATTPRATDSTPRTDAGSSAILASNASVSVDKIYEHEINSMRRIVDERLSELDPATVTEIERNFAIIDKAIADSRAALAKDPRSGFLSTQLDRALETKLSTLRKVALL